jgi:hypothetical protein
MIDAAMTHEMLTRTGECPARRDSECRVIEHLLIADTIADVVISYRVI